jgi:hypothetical protein
LRLDVERIAANPPAETDARFQPEPLRRVGERSSIRRGVGLRHDVRRIASLMKRASARRIGHDGARSRAALRIKLVLPLWRAIALANCRGDAFLFLQVLHDVLQAIGEFRL